MSQVSKELGKGAQFEFEGETFTISPWTYDIQAEYEKYFVGKAYANLRAARTELGSEYVDCQASLRRDIDAGDYEFGKPLTMKSLNSTRHFKHMLWLCLHYAHKDDPSKLGKITKALVERIADDEEKILEAYDIMVEVNRDPNSTPAGEPSANP